MNSNRIVRTNLLVACLCNLLAIGVCAAETVDFRRDVAPIFERHCLHCHSDNISKGDLSLSSIRDLVDNEYLVAGDPDASHLIDLISGDDAEMPKEGNKLSVEQVAAVRGWIASGADWPETVVLREQSKADQTWWSLQPLATSHDSVSIDDFIEAQLSANQLEMNGAADRKTLIRRATYDLTGLPPTPAQVQRFLDDPDPSAYEKLVDRLLASPEYGQRWGRHWLDVVRFGESNGFERNQIINDLWPFRDYVIRSFNEDKPFDQFIREHLAGDVLGAGDPNVEIGSAFLVAGPYDDVGNQDAVQAAQIRANTIDEIIRATGEAFLGLTIGCARCHDHKFDAILQRDYYQWYASFSGVRHGRRVLATEEEKSARKAVVDPLEAEKADLNERRNAVLARIDQRADENAQRHESLWTRDPVDRTGTEETFTPVDVRFVRLVAEGKDTDPNSGRGFRIDEFEIWSSGDDSRNVALASAGARASGPSRVIEDFPGAYGPQLAIDGESGARFISTADYLQIELPQPTLIDRVVFSSARDEIRPQQPKFVFVSDYRIEASTDGVSWSELAHGRDRKPVSDAHRKHRLRSLEASEVDSAALAAIDRQIRKVGVKLRAVPPLPMVWVGKRVAADAKGPFHVFIGGSPQRKGSEVVPASLSTLSRTTQSYQLDAEADESGRRMALADWIVRADNPLTPRVLVNRIWHYHFGTGIVATPSDFGYMGGRPTHPKLLDWLATRLVETGWRLKPIHKLIMMSRVYRQSSDYRQDAARVDGDGRWLWRFPPRRLSAEEIRDTMLAVSGSLDRRMGGNGFRLYRYMQDNVATYVPLDHHGRDTYRRAVYHQNARAARTDLMTDFDQPDCAFSVARRAETTTPLQALTTLNHSFTIDMADAMAARVQHEVGDNPGDQVRHLFRLCFARDPSDVESRECVELISEHGVATLCRVLLNTSELIYVL